MKSMFNGECNKCRQLRPRCATVRMRVVGKATVYEREDTVLCDNCRKELHGKYRLDERHR